MFSVFACSQLVLDFGRREISRSPPPEPFLDDFKPCDVIRRPAIPRLHVSDRIVRNFLEENSARTKLRKFLTDCRLVPALRQKIRGGLPGSPDLLAAIDPFGIDIPDPPNHRLLASEKDPVLP